jgi:hypothetical protein
MAKGAGKGAKGASRKIVFGVNTFFLACGIIVLACGIVAASATQDFRKNADIFRKTNVNAACTTILVCGIVTIALTVVGYIGLAKGNVIVLKAYIVIIGFTICMQLAMGAFVETRDPNSALHNYWYSETDDIDKDKKDDYQRYLDCCGWEELRDSFGPGMPLCDLSCYENPGTCPSCLGATNTWLQEKVAPANQGAIICGCIELLAILAPCYIIILMKKDKDDFFDDPFHY